MIKGMSGKELLYSIRDIDEDIADKLEKLEILKASVIGITARTDKEAVQSNGSQDKIGTLMAKILDLEKEINASTDNFVERKNLVKKLIFQLERESHQNVLYDLFICKMPLYEIADNYELTYKGAEKLKGRAIREFEKLYETYKHTI